MKKAIVASVLGLAGSIATTYGQGIILFNNYISHSYNPVLWGAGSGHTVGANVNTANVEVALFYAIGTYSSTSSFLTAAGSAVGTTFIDTALNNPSEGFGGTGPGGFFDDGSTITLAGWSTASPVSTFMVEGWDTTTGATFANAGVAGSSALWTETVDSSYPSSLSGYGIVPASVLIPEPMFTGMPTLTLVGVPEPTTLALAGFGGLASLVALRRKKA